MGSPPSSILSLRLCLTADLHPPRGRDTGQNVHGPAWGRQRWGPAHCTVPEAPPPTRLYSGFPGFQPGSPSLKAKLVPPGSPPITPGGWGLVSP